MMPTFLFKLEQQEIQIPTLAESLKQFKKDWVIGRWEKHISLKDYIELKMKYLSSQHNILFNNSLKGKIDKRLLDEVIQTQEDMDKQKASMASSNEEQKKEPKQLKG